MKVSAKTDYACRALLELALHFPSKDPLQIGIIAKRQHIPEKFLTQILLSLKQLGYIQSTRGKNGGYLLALEPKDIKLIDLIQNFESVQFFANGHRAASAQQHVMDLIWDEVNEAVNSKLDQINFELICNRKRSHDNVAMFHI